jgi:hypothetical protein
MSKRVVILSDTHCGHMAGLTPPDDWGNLNHSDPHKRKLARARAEAFAFYSSRLRDLYPIDIVVFNGDAIDGSGTRSGGVEQLTTDRNEQAAMAIECLKEAKAKQYVFVAGTPYHTGEGEDFEAQVADALGGERLHNHEWVRVNGVTFDLRHHIGSSSIPHGRATPLMKQWLWNQLWAVEDAQPKADIIIRSHVHTFTLAGGVDWIGMTTPALQLANTRFGARRCDGIVHFGFVFFDVSNDGSYQWGKRIARLEHNRATVREL